MYVVAIKLGKVWLGAGYWILDACPAYAGLGAGCLSRLCRPGCWIFGYWIPDTLYQ